MPIRTLTRVYISIYKYITISRYLTHYFTLLSISLVPHCLHSFVWCTYPLGIVTILQSSTGYKPLSVRHFVCCPFVSVPVRPFASAVSNLHSRNNWEDCCQCPGNMSTTTTITEHGLYLLYGSKALTVAGVLVCSLNHCCNSACCPIVHSLVSHLIIQLCRCITDPPQPPPLTRPRQRGRGFRCQWWLLHNSDLRTPTSNPNPSPTPFGYQ